MRNFNNGFRQFKRMFSTSQQQSPFSKLFQGPIAKIIALNTVMFLAWKIKGVSETFLVKHFSYERFNIRDHRYYTMLTYACSHFGVLDFLFNTYMISTFGRSIVASHGSRTLWLLYLGGAISGGFCMQLFKPYNSIVIPEVGAGPAVHSLLTFYAMQNLQRQFMIFFFPMKAWVILGAMAFFAFTDPSKKNVGGIMTGIAMSLIFKKKFM